MQSIDELLQQIDQITTAEQVKPAFDAVDAFLLVNGNKEENNRIQQALLDKLREIGTASTALIDEYRDTLRLNGVDYPLTEWITLTQYAKQFGVKNVETIMNWIKRGIVPADHVKEIEQLGLRLIRAVPYERRTYKKDA